MALDSLDGLEWHTQPSGPCTTQSPPFAFESQKNANQRRPPGARIGHRYADRRVALTSLLFSSDAGDAAL